MDMRPEEVNNMDACENELLTVLKNYMCTLDVELSGLWLSQIRLEVERDLHSNC